MKQTEEHQEQFIKWFADLGKGSVDTAGGKGANLAEMTNIGMPVPPGFMISAQAYAYFINKTGLKETIAQIVKEVDIENTAELTEGARIIREMITKALMPREMQDEILEAYDTLEPFTYMLPT